MIKVAIIDDGINNQLYQIDVVQSIVITPQLNIENSKQDSFGDFNHGSTCAAIIKKYYSKVEFTSISILDKETHKCNSDQLVMAIDWCICNSIKVVNISMGTIDYRDFKKIKNIVNKAYNNGVIIVAACSNKEVFTSPASCSNVIGVRSGSLDKNQYSFNLYPIDGIEIVACSKHKLYKNTGSFKITPICNSYATPMITAIVCSILEQYPDMTLEEIKLNLYRKSINYTVDTLYINNYRNIDWSSSERLIYIGEKSKNFRVDIIDKSQEFHLKYTDGIKSWNSSIVKNFFKEPLSKKKIDIPLIIIYGDKNDDIINVVKELCNKFRCEGYYAIGMSTEPKAILYDLEYIPTSDVYETRGIKNKIEMLYRIYDYDIIILALYVNKNNTYMIKSINEDFIVDIAILIKENYYKRIDDNNVCNILLDQTYSDKNNLNYKQLSLLYQDILKLLTCEND